jgi:SAM-dependent methyltransferase
MEMAGDRGARADYPTGEMSMLHESSIVHQAAEELALRLRAVETELAGGMDDEGSYTRVKTALDDCVLRLDALGLHGPDNRLPSSELWNIAGDWLQRGWLQNQARTKPRGYAGDYEMLVRIYENRLCDDPLGRLFDRYFQEEAAPRAVRNRMAMMTEWISQAVATFDRPWKVSIVGSAFGFEVRDALRSVAAEAREHVRVALLDLDPIALDVARRALAPLLSADCLTTISGNLFRLADRRTLAEPLTQSDLLLCPGLFDYLDDDAAVAMLRTFWERLAPGGRLAVFQFAPHNPTRAYMEWLGNWYLIYRTRDQLERLAAAAGLPTSQVELGSEPLGVDLLLSATRSA